MSSWLPSLPFSFSVPGWPATSSPDQPHPNPPHSSPSLSSSSRPRRFPSPPSRGSDAVQDDLARSPNGQKRARDGTNGASNSNSSVERYEEGFEADEMEEQGPQRKRRRGIVGTVLGTTLDAAIFTTALGYSAFQLWKHPPTKDDVDALMRQKQLMLSDSPHSTNQALLEAPPPYYESISDSQTASTSQHQPHTSIASSSQIPRRVRHAHEPRPRLSSRKSTFPSSPSKPLAGASFDFDPITPIGTTTRDPFANLAQGPLPEFQPYSSPNFRTTATSDQTNSANTEEEDDEEFEEDEEMRAVSDRLKSLIETGAQALASRPREWSSTSSSSTSTDNTRSRISTNSSIGSSIATKPSPLSQFNSRFDSPPSTSSPRQSLPNLTNFSSSIPSPSSSSNHSRRRSLDHFTHIPTPDVPSSPRSIPVSSNRPHRHTQSYGGLGVSSSQSLGALNERTGDEALDEFERVMERAKGGSRGSFGGGRS